MNIEQKLVSSVIGGLKALYGQDVPAAQVQLQKTKKEFEGHLTLVVFPFLRMSKKGPEQTAQEIGEYLQANESSVAAFNVIKGFLNLTIASSAWIELLNGIHADKPTYILHMQTFTTKKYNASNRIIFDANFICLAFSRENDLSFPIFTATLQPRYNIT